MPRPAEDHLVDSAGEFDDTRVIRQAFAILAGDRPTPPSREQEIEDLVASWSTRPANTD